MFQKHYLSLAEDLLRSSIMCDAKHSDLEKLSIPSTNHRSFNQTLAGGLVPQRHLHHFKHVLIRAAYELLVCSNSDLRILLGGAVQLQQHRSLKGGNCCQQLMLD